MFKAVACAQPMEHGHAFPLHEGSLGMLDLYEPVTQMRNIAGGRRAGADKLTTLHRLGRGSRQLRPKGLLQDVLSAPQSSLPGFDKNARTSCLVDGALLEGEKCGCILADPDYVRTILVGGGGAFGCALFRRQGKPRREEDVPALASFR